MTARIAFFTYGVLKKPVGDPLVQGFLDRLPAAYGAAEGSAGFFAWAEGAARIEQLHAQGSTAAAFTFKQPFDAAGQPAKLSRERIAAQGEVAGA